jgi:hypothetical protein
MLVWIHAWHLERVGCTLESFIRTVLIKDVEYTCKIMGTAQGRNDHTGRDGGSCIPWQTLHNTYGGVINTIHTIWISYIVSYLCKTRGRVLLISECRQKRNIQSLHVHQHRYKRLSSKVMPI